MSTELPLFQQAQYAFTAHIRAPDVYARPDDVEARRMAIYRELFFNNVNNFIQSCFPVLRSLMTDETWKNCIADFFAKHHSVSPYFSEIPAEFLSYLQTEKPASIEPTFPFLLELAHYEWMELIAQIATEEIPETNVLDETAGLFLSPLAYPLGYRFPVHQIGPQYQPTEASTEPTFIVVYRNRKDEVHFMVINALSYQLLMALVDAENGFTRAELFQALSEKFSIPYQDLMIQGQDLVADLIERDILITIE